MQSTPSHTDARTFAADKMKELQDVENLIESLRSQLLAAENRRTIIQEELASSNPLRKGIQSLPLELLCAIFLRIDDVQRERNRRLTLVCKLWRTVVNGTPQFWTHILVKWKDVRDLIEAWRYMDLCIEKSQNLPLDVTFDFSFMPNFAFYIWCLAAHDLEQIRSGGLGYSLSEYQETLLTAALDVHRQSYDSLIAKTIRKIGNPEGSRCLSVQLSLPCDFDDASGILSNICERTTNLAKLDYRRPEFAGDSVSTVTRLPSLPTLTHFETDQDVKLHSSTFLTLEHVVLDNAAAASRFLMHAGSCLSKLRFLSVFLWEDMHLERLGFPSLHTLKLKGRWQGSVLSILEAPNLDSLYLEQIDMPQHIKKLIPSLKTLSLGVDAWGEDPVPSSVAKLKLLLPQLPNVVSCTLLSTRMCHSISEVVAPAIEDVRAGGTALLSLERIIVANAESGAHMFRHEVDVSIRNTGVEKPCG